MIETNLTSWLQSLPAATVRPLLLRKGDALPALVYTPVSSRRPLGIDGSGYARFARIQVDSWGETYEAAKTLAQSVEAIHGFAGDFYGQAVGLVEAEKNFDELDEETRRYRVSYDITIYY
ncbi:hypothetical protein [Microbulbifer sp. JSM ZJ756]|uniref:tail completion protein gp17 n=1 Tax=Microbulbifer sp. JSM ZJ756 TaxID=3376191 RepID=UPI0037BAB08A